MNFLRFWFPVLAYSGIIFYVSSLETVKTPQSIPHFDKVCHLAEYGLFGLLLARAISHSVTKIDRIILIAIAALGAFLYGLTDEFHQSLVPGRQADVADLVADTVGGLLGGLIYIIFEIMIKKRIDKKCQV
ncbi:MAG: VanZ family protein [Candidatus Omnitrophica bacterium]|nr:VanZ family protein [Candidatus Omnitrophota bacterium]